MSPVATCVDRDKVLFKVGKPGWRNGRRGGLKIHCPKGRAGSNPAPGTVVLNRLGRSERCGFARRSTAASRF
jgi:hypothetical protein